MDNKLVMISIAAVIGIIVLGSVLMPILDDATATTDTFENDGSILGYMIPIDDETTYAFQWDVTTPNIAVVNGENINLYAGSVICGGDPDFIVRYYSGSTNYMQGRDAADHNFTANSTLSITIASGTITIVYDTDNTTTYTVDSGFAIAKTGTYVMKSPTAAAYMNGDTPFYAYGVSSTDGPSLWMKITGTIDDGATAERISGASGTFSNVVVHSEAVSDHLDLYKLSEITLTFTNTNTSVDTDLTYNFFIVPLDVTAERAQHFTNNQNALFAAIPILLIVAILIGVVALVIRSRLD